MVVVQGRKGDGDGRAGGRAGGQTDEEEGRNGMNVNDNDGAKEASSSSSATLFCRFSPPTLLLALHLGGLQQKGILRLVWYN